MVLLISKNILSESDSLKSIMFRKALLHYFNTEIEPLLPSRKLDLIIR